MRLRLAVLIGLVLGNVGGLLFTPTPLAAAGSSTVVISEVMPGYSGHSSDEFIEFYNPTTADVSLGKWTLQYHAAASTCTTSWTTKATTTLGTIAAHGFYLLGVGSYATAADAKSTSSSFGLGDTAGTVRLLDNTGAVIDTVGWGGNNACAEGNSVAAPLSGGSLERKPGPYLATAGNNLDTDDNASDFVSRSAPEPQSTTAPAEVPVVTDAATIMYASPVITEVQPTPTLGQDAFIEVFNPTLSPMYVGGYAITADSGQYVLSAVTLAPQSYLVLTASVTHLNLPSAGSLQLLDPAGSELDGTAPWSGAVPGESWSLMPGGWLWTTSLTPGATNVETDPVVLAPGLGSVDAASLAPLQLTELLPNPAAPATDAADEFVELYNPNDQPVNLSGYTLKSGTNLGNKATLDAVSVPANGYVALYSKDTKLPLANNGSSVALFDPAGAQVDGVVTYEAATEGQAFALIGTQWEWTTTPTPAAPNVLTAPPAPLAKLASVKTVTKKAPKVTAPKATKAAKTAAPKKTKLASTKSVLAAAARPASAPWLLWSLIILTIGFVLYEFRHDLLDYYHRSRRHFGRRGAPRPRP